jgi:hypothetical protein
MRYCDLDDCPPAPPNVGGFLLGRKVLLTPHERNVARMSATSLAKLEKYDSSTPAPRATAMILIVSIEIPYGHLGSGDDGDRGPESFRTSFLELGK